MDVERTLLIQFYVDVFKHCYIKKITLYKEDWVSLFFSHQCMYVSMYVSLIGFGLTTSPSRFHEQFHRLTKPGDYHYDRQGSHC
jgi:hypothetical protein